MNLKKIDCTGEDRNDPRQENFREVLKPGEYRVATMASHPLIKNTLLLPTPFVKTIFKACERAVMYNLTGCSFQAPPRFGKSFAAKACRLLFARTYPEIPFYIFSGKQHTSKKSEMEFWQDLLGDLRHPAANSHKVGTMRVNLLNLIIAECQRRDRRDVIVLFDEAQELSELQLHFLKGFYNSLEMLDDPINVITCFIGQSEFYQRIVDVQLKIDLNDRFFPNHKVLYGTRTESDLESILKLFDDPEVAEFPEGSNISYTEFFLPLAYAGGWRLSAHAGQIWKELTKVTASKNVEFKMSAIIRALKGFFILKTASDSEKFRATHEDWVKAIAFSPFKEIDRGGKNL